jgi:hypothetical protein
LPKSVFADTITILMPTQQVHLWAKNTGIEGSQWAVDTMGIQQEKAGFTLQWKDNEVRDSIREIANCLMISNKSGASPSNGIS